MRSSTLPVAPHAGPVLHGRATVVLCLLAAVACASARSGLPVRSLGPAPFYYSYQGLRVPDSATVGHLLVRLDETFLEEMGREGAPVHRLVDVMNAFLDSAGWTVALDAPPNTDTQGPEVYVGAAAEDTEDEVGEPEARTETPPATTVRAFEGSRRWRESLRGSTQAAGVDFVLAIAVGVAEYSTFNCVAGYVCETEREFEIGTGHRVRIGGLSGWRDRADVLHVTGMLLTSDGEVVRVGSEGIVAKKHGLLAQIAEGLAKALLGAEHAIYFSEAEIEALVTDERRRDLDGEPLSWQVALQNLVAQLLRRQELLRW